MKPLRSLIAGAAMLTTASTSWGIGIEIDKFLNTDMVDSFTEDLGAALSYKAVTPAEPLGLIGIDIGLEITATDLANIDKYQAAFGTTEDSVLLPLPKLHVHKGLPMGIDLGLVYSKVPTTDIGYIGGEIRYSPLGGNVALPAVAVRGTYTTLLGVDGASLSTKGVELTVSKGFLMLTPYAGIGNVWANSTIETGLPLIGDLEGEASMFKWFVGLNLNLGLMNLVYETDTTGDSMSHSVKMGFRF